jgi:PD-(D/E)XK nuclease superfamily
MKLSNKHNLPQPFVNLFHKQEYSKGAARISVTELINSPRIVALKHKHGHEIEEDIADRFWALMGTNIHRILQEGSDAEHVAEERLFHEVDGWVVSGGIDLQRTHDDGVDVIDWKFTSAYTVMQDKPEWEAQLNCYAWLVRKVKVVEPHKLFVCGIVRDWDKNKAVYDRAKGYPQAPVVMVPVRKWDARSTDLFVLGRVAAHRNAARISEWDEVLPECSDSDRWVRGSTFGVYKSNGAGGGDGKGRRALRVFSTPAEASEYADGKGPGYEVLERKGEAIRCVNNYCGVAKWCDQFNGGSE